MNLEFNYFFNLLLFQSCFIFFKEKINMRMTNILQMTTSQFWDKPKVL